MRPASGHSQSASVHARLRFELMRTGIETNSCNIFRRVLASPARPEDPPDTSPGDHEEVRARTALLGAALLRGTHLLPVYRSVEG